MKEAVAAALLRQGGRIDGVSRLITAAAAIALMLRAASALVLLPILAAGVAQLYLAVRVAFDAELFALGDTDEALLAFGLLPATKAGRPIEAKLAGARRLLLLQASTFGAQLVLACALPFLSDPTRC